MTVVGEKKAAKPVKTPKSVDNGHISGETIEFPLSDLRLFARNPRKGNIAAIAASLQAHGQYRPVVANIGTFTGRKNEVLAGNHTIQAFRTLTRKYPEELRWQRPLVHWVDVDDDQAKRIVLADNKTPEGGSYLGDVLAGLLEDADNDYDGLGYSAADLARLTPDYAPDIDPDALMDLQDALDETGAELDRPRPPSPPSPPPPPPPPSGDLPAVLAFTVVFDDPFQRGKWLLFLRWLEHIDPDSTPSERLTGYLEKFLSRQLQEDEQR